MPTPEVPLDLRGVLVHALDLVPDGVIVFDEALRVLYFNHGAERIFGASGAGMVGQPLSSLMPPHLLAVHEQRIGAFAASPEVSVRSGRPLQFRIERRDGSSIPAEAVVGKLVHGRRQLFLATIRDMTHRVGAERALQESEERYRSIFENSLDGILLSAPDGRIFAANPAACAILGRTEEDIRRAGRGELLDPTDPRLAPGLRQRAETGSFCGELYFLRPDGSRLPCDVSSSIFEDREGRSRAIVIFRDITERAQAFQLLEQRVEERTRELTALLEASRNLAATLELTPLLSALLTQLKTVIPYAGAGIAILEDDETLRMLDYVGPAPREKMLVEIPLDRESGYREVVRCQEPYIIDDIWGDAAWVQGVRDQWSEEQLSEEVRSWLGVPLIAKGRLIGVLRLDHGEPGYFTQAHGRLALAFADQAAAAIENARLYEQAQQLAVLEERQRLARELHDSVSQALYGMTLGARTARALVAQDPGRAVEALDYVLSLTEAAFAEMRALIFELRPNSLAEEGLVAALTRQAELLRARHHLQVETEFCPEPELPLSVKTALYRIGQEALNNVVKHARATRVTLRLVQEPEAMLLQVEDDGTGFDAGGTFPGHLGLRSMRERAEGAGGTLEVMERPGGGAVIRARIPLAGAQ
jgi:PAS domain S-box-containing protein